MAPMSDTEYEYFRERTLEDMRQPASAAGWPAAVPSYPATANA